MFAIPSLRDLVERARRSFRVNLPGSDAWIWPNNINPVAKVLAGMVHEIFGFADYISRQKFALTADLENLILHGEELGITLRPAASSRGKVRLTATGALVVEVGAIFRRTDDLEYRAAAGGVLTGAGTMLVEVIATTDGLAGNALAESPLEIISGVEGDALAEVDAGGIAGGTDVEDVESFRERILFRKRNPPHSGAAADYVMWAKELAGVTRVFVEPLWSGVGTVRVFPLMDDLYADGIPPPVEVARIADHIETLRPAGASVTIEAATPVVVDVEITNLLPDTTATREAVLTELRAAFRRLSRVAGTANNHAAMPFLASAASFSRSWLWQAVANATGEERHIITAPSADIALAAGEMPVLGNVSFVSV